MKNHLYTKLRVALMRSALTRTEYLVKNKVFRSTGQNFFFQPRIIPQDPQLIKFHDNVAVASGVVFINHDVIQKVLNQIDKRKHFEKLYSCIEVMDNVFIGANSVIIGNVRIGPNVIVAAGSIVTKDVPPNSVVAGVPAKVVGTFEDFYNKRYAMKNKKYESWSEQVEDLWKEFDELHHDLQKA